MELYDKLLKPITETTYLNVSNTERYRVIIRFFFRQYENLQYWLYKEDVYEMMKQHDIFQDYTIEKCQSDLQQLAEWGNLSYVQDTSKVSTLSDFLNRQFRYRLSQYTVEIERMTLKLENLEIEGASLQPTLLERIMKQIKEIKHLMYKSDAEVSGWWQSISNDFIRLNHDYQDYISTLNSAKAEEMMKSKEFLLFKDKLIMYLRSFVKALQEQALIIESEIRKISEDELEIIFQKIVAYELSIPRMDGEINPEDIYHNCKNRWDSIYRWFVGENGDNEVNRLNMITNDIIRKITRYAMQIGELHNQGANRKEEYRKIAEVFKTCETINEAHRLSSFVFGCETTMHLKNIPDRDTDSINSGVYEEAPIYHDLEIRARVVRNKSSREPAKDYELEKNMQKMELIERMEKSQKMLSELIQDQKIIFSTLPVIEPQTRKILLSWLSKALTNEAHRAKTDTGQYYTVEKEKDGECILKCSDGLFKMPCFVLIFEEKSQ